MIIIDTETTGKLKPTITDVTQQPKIIEFAGIKLHDDTLEEISRLTFLVNPEEKLTPDIVELTKITDLDLKEQPTFDYFYPKLVDFFLGEKYLIAHNVFFDISILCFALERIGRLTQFPYPPNQICTVNKTRSLAGYDLNLTKLYQYMFNEDFPTKHRAIQDTEALTRCVKELIKTNIIKLNK